MGLTTCISIIYINKTDVEFFEIDEIDEPKISKLKNLCPKNLSISAIKNNTIVIFWEGLINFMRSENEEGLTEFEQAVFEIFPKSLVFTTLISDVVNLRYFALVENGKILRKKGTHEGKIDEDRGPLLTIEKKILKILDDSSKGKHIEQFKNFKKDSLEDEIFRMVYFYFSKMEYFTKYDYKNGSLDEYIIDHFFNKLTSEDILDYYNNTKFAVFPITKWNKSKHQTIGKYIHKGVVSLLKSNEIRELDINWMD